LLEGARFSSAVFENWSKVINEIVDKAVLTAGENLA
jgi:hypothetical protein